MKNVYPKLVTDLMDRLEALKLFQLQVGFQNDLIAILIANYWPRTIRNPFSVDHQSFMEINLNLLLEKSMTVNGVAWVDNNDNNGITMQYKDSWSRTYTCAKCKLLLRYT